MKDYLVKIILIAMFIFVLPAWVALFIINLIKTYVLGEKNIQENKKFKLIHYLISFIAWLIIGGWLIYNGQFESITYVYACSPDNQNICYKVRADYVPKECPDTEWDLRGPSGGKCIDPYIEKIYFDNGGYRIFEYCDMVKKNMWICYSKDDNNEKWNIQLSETIRVKK